MIAVVVVVMGTVSRAGEGLAVVVIMIVVVEVWWR